MRRLVVIKCSAVGLAMFMVSISACSAQDYVSTVGGISGVVGHADGTALRSTFNRPYGITAIDGELYVADSLNHDIRVINLQSGIVTTIAGRPGSPGDKNGTADNAMFFAPSGISSDGVNLYVADTNNASIREINLTTNIVKTIAGPLVREIGHRDGSGADARFFAPYGLATNGADLYVSDPVDETIRKVVIATGAVTTIAGRSQVAGDTDAIGTEARFDSPMGLALEGTNLYVSDGNNCTIRKINLKTMRVTTIAGKPGVAGYDNGVGRDARFRGPTGLAIRGPYLYISDSVNRVVRRMNLKTRRVATIAGTVGESGHSDGKTSVLAGPDGLAIVGGYLYVADSLDQTIRKVELSGGR